MDDIMIIIVDDHKMIASGISAQLDKEEGITVVEVITSPENLMNKIKEYKIDVILMDIRMGQYNGIELAKEIKKENANIKIILMSGYNISQIARNSVADAFTSKEESIASLVQTIKKVCIDQANVFPICKEEVKLTNAEIKVLRLISQDMTRKEIAAKLYISEKTVTNHISSILDKLQARSRIGAIMKGIELGLID